MALQIGAAKNCLWQSSTVITLRYGGSNTQQNKGKSPMTHQKFDRAQPSNFGQNNYGSHGNLVGSGSNGASSTRDRGNSPRMLKQILKGILSRLILTRIRNRREVFRVEVTTPSNMAKNRLFGDEVIRRRTTVACVNCSEVGHMFNDCPKPKP